MNIITRVYSSDEDYQPSNYCYFKLTQELIDIIQRTQKELIRLKETDRNIYNLSLWNHSCFFIESSKLGSLTNEQNDLIEKVNDDFDELFDNHRNLSYLTIDSIPKVETVRLSYSLLLITDIGFRFEAGVKHCNTIIWSEELSLNYLLDENNRRTI